MTTTLASGIDRVFQIPTAFSACFMKDPAEATRRMFGPSHLPSASGRGGSHAFADPEHGISFAYVMNQMEQSLYLTRNPCVWWMPSTRNDILLHIAALGRRDT